MNSKPFIRLNCTPLGCIVLIAMIVAFTVLVRAI